MALSKVKQKLRGLIGSIFFLGNVNGPQLKPTLHVGATVARIDVRDDTDSGFAQIRADASVATSADLPTPATMPEGYVIVVRSQRAFYLAQPNVSGGRWVRLVSASTGTWAGAPDLYISPTGTADAAGTASNAPITAAELQARKFACNANGENDTAVTVHVAAGSYPATTWRMNPRSGIGGVYFQGTQTAGTASALTARTARNRATNTPLQVTDAAAAWAAGQLVVFQTANVGASLAVAKSLGAGAVRATTAITIGTILIDGTGINPLTNFPTEVTPAANNAYSIVTLPTFASLSIFIPGGDGTAFFAMAISDIKVTGTYSIVNEGGQYAYHLRVMGGSAAGKILVSNPVGGMYFISCFSGADGWEVTNGSSQNDVEIIYGGSLGAVYSANAGVNAIIFDIGFLAQGPSSTLQPISGVTQFGDVAAFDSLVAVQVQTATLNLQASSEAPGAAVWGTSAVASSYTFNLLPGGLVRNRTGLSWALTCPFQGALHATTDCKIGGANDCNSFVRATGVWSAGAITMTIVDGAPSHLDAAAGAAGFGGHAWSPEYQAGLVTG